MCLNPLTIKNKKLQFNPLVDRVFNIVPCGKCIQCKDKYLNDITVRCIAEYLKNIRHTTLYVTLTYDELHCPRLDGKRCFSVSNVQKFFKRFRKRLSDNNINVGFRYFLVSEYGTKNTKRPHHHALLFFDTNLLHDDFNVLDDVKSFIVDCWQYGEQVSFGKYGGVVNSLDAINYVCKYITKNVDFVDVNNLGSKYNYMHIIHKEDLTFVPFHLESLHFGECLLNWISKSDFVRGMVRLPVPNKKTSDPYTDYSIPLYIIRKKLYETYKNINQTISYRLTDFGVLVKKEKFLQEYKEFKEKFIVFKTNFRTVKYSFESSNNVLSLVFDYINSIDIIDIFLYRSFLRYSTHDCFVPSSLIDVETYYLEKQNVFNGFSSAGFYPYYLNVDYELVLFFYDYYYNYFRYDLYKSKVDNYNSLQEFRFLCGIYKEVHYDSLLSRKDYMKYYNYNRYCDLISNCSFLNFAYEKSFSISAA